MSAPGRWQLEKALSALKHGEVIAYPTEGVWGLGCDPFNADAVDRLLALKNRPMDKGLILVAANLNQISPLLSSLSGEQLSQLKQSVSGESTNLLATSRPTTWLIPGNGLIPYWITGAHQSVAVRISKHPMVAALCQAFGGMIVSTSANPSAQAPALTQLATRHYFGKQIPVYLNGKVSCSGMTSEIRDLVTGDVLR